MSWLILFLTASATPGSYGLGVDPWRPNATSDGPLSVLRDSTVFLPPEDGRLRDRDGCPILLRVDDCESDSFWQTQCGAKALLRDDLPGACVDAFEAYATGSHSSLSRGSAVDPLTGQATEAWISDSNVQAFRWLGLDATYAPYLLQLTHPRNAAESYLAGLELLWWQDNCSVQSCGELAFEAHRDYSVFEVAAAQDLRDEDYRAIFDRAYGATGIARRTLRSLSGEPLPPLNPNTGRGRYLPGFRGFSRGPLYGFEPGNAPRIAWNASNLTPGLGTPQLAVPYLLHALGDLDDTYLDADDVIATDIAVDFRDHCAWGTITGHITCDPDAASTSTTIAALFNARLFDWQGAPIARIPEASEWPAPGSNPWDVHQSASDALSAAQVSDEALIWLEDRQADFGDLRRQREQLYSRLVAMAAVMAVPPIDRCSGILEFPLYCDSEPETEVAELMAELASVDAQMAVLIDRFDDNLCLGPAPTPCDWSPRWFANATTGHYRDERQALYSECILRTGDDFRSLRQEPGSTEPFWLVSENEELSDSSVGAICDVTDTRTPNPRCEVRSDYLQDDATVRSYFATVDAWGEAFTERWNFPVNPDTGLPTLGGTVSDMASLGDADFGVDMAYSAGWAVPTLSPLPNALTATAHGQLQIGAKVFGEYVPIIWSGDESEIGGNPVADGFAARRRRSSLAFIDLYASNRGTGTDAWMVFDLLGTELYRDTGGSRSPGTEGPLSYHYVAEPEAISLTENVGSVQSTVFVGPVPLNLRAGAAGTVGIESRVQMDATGGSDATGAHLEAFSVFRPFARASVFAEASLGVDALLSGGIRADLDLIELGLPVTTTVDASFDPLRNDTDLTVDVSADLDVILLRGGLKGFIRVLGEEYSQTLFRFGGFTQSAPLASTQFDADLTAIQRAFGIRNDGEDAATLRRGTTAESRLIESRPGQCDVDTRVNPSVYVDFDDEHLSDDVLVPVYGDATFDATGTTDGLLGIHGQAIRTDNALLSTVSASNLLWLEDFAVSFWFRNEPGTNGIVYAQGTDLALENGLRVEVLDNGRISVRYPCGDATRPVSAQLRREVEWHHVVLSYDQTTRQALTVVDGQPLATVASCYPHPIAGDIHIGGALTPDGPVNLNNVTIDELGIWEGTALDLHQARELLAHGDAGLPLAGPGSAPLTTVRNVNGLMSRDQGQIRLSVWWDNPPSLDDPEGGYDRVIARYATDAYPTRPDEGELLHDGTDGGGVTFLPLGTPRVYVSTWAAGPAGIAAGDRIEVSPDAVDLPPVSNAMAVPGDGSVRVSWTLPTDPNVATVIVAQSNAPLTRPGDGAILTARRTDEVRATGLPNDVTAVFTIWTQDGFGRLSQPVSVSATPFAGAEPDVLAPGSVTQVQAYATRDRVFLQWDLPFNLDPLRTVVRRVERGVFRRTLGTVSGNVFEDREVVPGRTYRYELAAIDPAGNMGPGVALDVSVEDVAPLSSLTAEVVGTGVDLSWPFAPSGTSVVVTRSELGPPQTAWEGQRVCERSGLRSSCTDADVPADVPLFYSAFVRDGSSHSAAVSTSAFRSVPTGQAGDDRDVFVGERVDLVADGVTDAAWSADVPLIHDASGTWFLATEPGTVTVAVTGTQGSDDIDDDAVITVLPYTGTTSQTDHNPLTNGRLAGAGVRALFARDGGLVADLGSGELLLVQGLVETPLTLPGCSTLRHVEGNLAICGDSFQTVRGFDLTTGAEVWSAPGPQGTWVSDLSGGVFALLTTSLGEDAEVRIALVDETAHLLVGTAVLAADTGVPLHLALDATGDTLAVASFNRVSGFAVSGLAGTVETFPLFTESITDTGIADVAWVGDTLALAIETHPTQAGRLRQYSVGTALVELRDVPAPVDVRAIRPTDDGMLVLGSRDAMTLAIDGTVHGPFTASSYALQDAVVIGTEVWAAAVVGDGIAGDHVTVHPASFPRASGDAPVLFDPLDIGFSFVDALVTAEGTWVAKALDQLAVGTSNGMTYSASVGFSTAPFELANMVCTDDQQVTYVGDVAGVPSVVRAPIEANALLPSTSWPIPDSCTAGVCGAHGAVMVCGRDLIQYDLATGDELRRTPVPSEMAAPTVSPSPTGALLTDFGPGGERHAAVRATPETLTATASAEVPDYFGGGVLAGNILHVPGMGPTERTDLSGAMNPMPPVPPADAEVLAWDEALMSLTATRRDAVLRAGDTGLLAASTGEKSFGITADQGLVLANTGSQVIAHRTAPLGVMDDITTARAGDALTTEVRLDDSLDLTGVRVQCASTTGSCAVDDVDPTRRIATISWAAGTSPGDHELLVWVGTHRWFTTTTERISVELP